MNHEPSDPLTSTATRFSRPVARLDAARETAKSSSSAARRTRSRVSADTSGEPRRARDTVDTETPARSATSAMLEGDSGVMDQPFGCCLTRLDEGS